VRAVLSLRIALLSEIVWYSIIIDVEFVGVKLWEENPKNEFKSENTRGN